MLPLTKGSLSNQAPALESGLKAGVIIAVSDVGHRKGTVGRRVSSPYSFEDTPVARIIVNSQD